MWTAAHFIIEGRMRPYGRRLCTVDLVDLRGMDARLRPNTYLVKYLVCGLYTISFVGTCVGCKDKTADYLREMFDVDCRLLERFSFQAQRSWQYGTAVSCREFSACRRKLVWQEELLINDCVRDDKIYCC